MKRLANAGEEPVVIPVIVVAVDVHVALVVVPPVERGEMCDVSSIPLSFEYSQDCIVCEGVEPYQYIVPSIFMYMSKE